MNTQEPVKTTKAQDAEILRIVKEWMRGCSCAEKVPSGCTECTIRMAYAIEHLVFKIPSRDEIRSKLAMMKRGEKLKIGGHLVEFSDNGVFFVILFPTLRCIVSYSLKVVVDELCKHIGAK